MGQEGEIWQDRDVRFDVRPDDLKLRRGEILIEKLKAVEDTKGNNGERGILHVTNLRVMWFSAKLPRVNLTVGWACVGHVAVKQATSRLRGNTESCYVLTRTTDARYEFLFTNLAAASSSGLAKVITEVHEAYESSRAFRDVKVRSVLVQNKQLKLLPQEEIMSTINGVWNLSNDQGNLGVLIVTNVRIVWYSTMNDNFNVSVPYIQIISIGVRSSKFGTALVVECTKVSGAYILGFRIDPEDKLSAVAKELNRLHIAYQQAPNYGVFTKGNRPEVYQDDDELAKMQALIFTGQAVDDSPAKKDVMALYYSEGGVKSNRKVVFCEELRVAMEKPPHGVTIKDLWNVSLFA